jgi:hypothetical protein
LVLWLCPQTQNPNPQSPIPNPQDKPNIIKLNKKYEKANNLDKKI